MACGESGPEAAKRHDRGDADLVAATLCGELPAFDELVGRYQRRAVAVAYRLLNNRDDAMEVVQDAFLRAYEKLDSLSKPGHFGAWLLRIVSNLALNRRRARALRQTASLEEMSESRQGRSGINRPDPRAVTGEAAASAKEVKRLIDQAVNELPELQRQALMMFTTAKLPQKEIAKLLGISVEAVKWHVFDARRKLKDRLKDYL